MSILTKEERANHRSRSEAATCSQWEIRCLARGDDFCPYTELIRALDTIDALEKERDQARELADFLEKNDARKPRAGTRIKSNL